MDYKYEWQGNWYGVKKNVLRELKSKLPDQRKIQTVVTRKPLPDIITATTCPFESVEEARDAFAGKNNHYIYPRISNPTVKSLENTITLLEAGHFARNPEIYTLNDFEIGNLLVQTLAFDSGMSAIRNTLFTLLSSGDTMITDKILYGCTDNLINEELKRFNIKVVEADFSDLNQIEEAFENNPGAKLVYFETPVNPKLSVRDIQGISEIASKNNALVVVDNTFATPYFQNPLRLGADIVINSMTKYIGGHAISQGGSVTGPCHFISENKQGCLFYSRRVHGGVLSPTVSREIQAGLMTLPERMEKHCDNAKELAYSLVSNPRISKVYYPGLYENLDIAGKQMKRFGGMLAFDVDGTLEDTIEIMNRIPRQNIGYIAVSLGAPFTVIEHPASMTHFFVKEEERKRKGITDTLVRVSVGREHLDDLKSMFMKILE